MNKKSIKFKDELDITDLILLLWKGKTTLIFFLLIALLSSTIFLFLIDDNRKPSFVYEISVEYEAENIPPGYEITKTFSKVLIDYQRFFNSKKLFNQWKQENSDVKIVYDDIVYNEHTKNKVSQTSEVEENFVTFVKKDSSSFIVFRHSNVHLFDKALNYATFINEKLSNHYFNLVESEYKIIKEKINDPNLYNTNSITFLNLQLKYERYLKNSLNEVSKAIFIHRPSPILMYDTTGPSKFLKISIFTCLGLILGIIYLLIVSLFNTNKKKNKNL